MAAPANPDYSTYDGYLDTLGVVYHEFDQTGVPPTMRLQSDTATMALRPSRQDTGLNPLEQRPESGDFFSQADFSHGAGQDYYHHPGRDDKKFYTSEGFDISRPGRLRHLHPVVQVPTGSVSASAASMTQAGGFPFVCDGTTLKKSDGTFPGVWAAENVQAGEAAGSPVSAVTTDGANVYAVYNGHIHKRDGAGTWTHYGDAPPTGNYTGLAWVKGRLIAVNTDGLAAPTSNVYEVVASGAAPAPVKTVTGGTFNDIFANGPYVYVPFIAINAGYSTVYHFGLNQTATALEVKGDSPLPGDQVCYTGAGYLNFVYLGCGKRTSAGGADPLVYQAIPDANGFLQLVKLVEDEGSGALLLQVRAIAAYGEQVLFGFSLASGATTGAREGIAVHYLARDALSYHLAKDTPAASPNRVLAIMVYKGRVLFTVSGDGLYYEDLGKYKATATLITSLADWSSGGQKTWSTVNVNTRPLPAGAGAQVALAYTLKHPIENAFNAVSGTGIPVTGSGVESGTGRLVTANKSAKFALKFTSSAQSDQLAAPELLGFDTRSDPSPATVEWELTRYIRVMDPDRKDYQSAEVSQDPDVVKNQIENMAYTWITVSEADQTWTAWVESVRRIEPEQPIYDVTSGQPRRDMFVIEVRLIATKG